MKSAQAMNSYSELNFEEQNEQLDQTSFFPRRRTTSTERDHMGKRPLFKYCRVETVREDAVQKARKQNEGLQQKKSSLQT